MSSLSKGKVKSSSTMRVESNLPSNYEEANYS